MSKPVILFKYASRGRPERFFRGLESIINNIADKDNFFISCTLDEDDVLMRHPSVIHRINQYPKTSIAWGESKSKIDAINRDVPGIGWDVLVNFSDDMTFTVFGFDEMIRAEYNNNFPEGDAYLHFPEKDSMSALCVMTIFDRKYYNRFGYIYHPDYKSLFCDNEQMEVAKMLGRYIYIPYIIFEHRNPAYSEYGEVRDAMFDEQQKVGWEIDQQTYNRRKALNFEIK